MEPEETMMDRFKRMHGASFRLRDEDGFDAQFDEPLDEYYARLAAQEEQP